MGGGKLQALEPLGTATCGWWLVAVLQQTQYRSSCCAGLAVTGTRATCYPSRGVCEAGFMEGRRVRMGVRMGRQPAFSVQAGAQRRASSQD